jgi:hypothetical protein
VLASIARCKFSARTACVFIWQAIDFNILSLGRQVSVSAGGVIHAYVLAICLFWSHMCWCMSGAVDMGMGMYMYVGANNQ